jgi:MFS family permease
MIRRYILVLTNRNVLLIIVSSLFLSFSNAFFMWMLPIVFAKLSSILYLGFAYTVAYILSSPLSLIAGVIADHYGRKPVIIVSTLLILVAYLIALSHLNIIIISIALVLLNVSVILSRPAVNSLIAESVESSLRGYAFTVITFTSYMSLAIGSFILGRLSMRNLNYILLFISLLCFPALLMRLFLRETLAVKYDKKNVMTSSVQEIIRFFKNVPSTLRNVQITYIYLSLMAMLGSTASTLFSIYIPVYLNMGLRLSMDVIGLVYTIAGITPLLVILIGGYLVEALGSLVCLQLSLLLMAFPTLILTFLPYGSSLTVITLISASTLASALSQVSSNTLIANLAPQNIRAAVFSLLAALSLLASIAAPSLGALIFSLNMRLIPLVIGILFILSFKLSILLKLSVTKDETSKGLS